MVVFEDGLEYFEFEHGGAEEVGVGDYEAIGFACLGIDFLFHEHDDLYLLYEDVDGLLFVEESILWYSFLYFLFEVIGCIFK